MLTPRVEQISGGRSGDPQVMKNLTGRYFRLRRRHCNLTANLTAKPVQTRAPPCNSLLTGLVPKEKNGRRNTSWTGGLRTLNHLVGGSSPPGVTTVPGGGGPQGPPPRAFGTPV